MKFLFILALCLVTVLAHPYPHDVGASPYVEISGRITNGQNATAGQIPYQVGLNLLLENTLIAFCGGSLIDKEWVMTAAHCTASALLIEVVLGATNLNNPETKQTISFLSIVQHPGYNSTSLENDIALLKIRPVQITTRTKTISIPAPSDVDLTYVGMKAMASGWGRTSDNSTTTKNLQYANLTIVNKSLCEQTYGQQFPTIVCAPTPNYVSTCNGDSGGPLVLEGTQIGIVSFGAAVGCEKGKPVGFTSVNKFVDWIISKTGI